MGLVADLMHFSRSHTKYSTDTGDKLIDEGMDFTYQRRLTTRIGLERWPPLWVCRYAYFMSEGNSQIVYPFHSIMVTLHQ